MIAWIPLLTVALAGTPDRSAAPIVPPSTPLALPEETVETLRPGVRVHWLPVPGVRHVEIELRLGRGSIWLDGHDSPADDLTGDLWTVAAKGWSASKLEQAAGLDDVSLSASVRLRSTTVSLSVPRDRLDRGLDLLDTVLHAPTYPSSEVKRSIADTLQLWETGYPTDPQSLASLADQSAWYPASDPRSPRPDLEALRHVKRADLRARQRRLLTEAPVDVLVVGDVEPAALRARIVSLLQGVGADAPPADPLPPRAPGVTAVIGVDVPGADQAILTLHTVAPLRGAPEQTAMEAIQFAMGGQFLSRLNKNLREEKGWTYGGYSDYDANRDESSWSFHVQVAEENVGAAIAEIQHEIGLMAQGGVTTDEKAAGLMGAIAAWNITLESASSAASALADRVAHQEHLADARARLDAAAALDLGTTAPLAAATLQSADHVWVIVGDRSQIEAQLADRIGAAVWFDPVDVTAGQVTVERAE